MAPQSEETSFDALIEDVLEAADTWAIYQEPDSIADQQTDVALRIEAESARARLLGAIEAWRDGHARL